MAVTAKSPNAVRAFTPFCPAAKFARLRDLDRFALLLGCSKAHGCGAFQLVPGEALAFDGALESFEQNYGKQLPIREPLQPNLAQQPGVFFGFGLSAFQGEGES